MVLAPNPRKNLIIDVAGKKYARYPVKTRLITPQDKDLTPIIREYAGPHLLAGDIIFVSEKIVSIIQGRSYAKDTVKVSKLAKFLSRFVTKTPIGIGLGSPETMQLAIEETGVLRLFAGVLAAAITKPLGIKGVFYMVTGDKARSIDGAVPYAIPPYNKYVTKGPANAPRLAEEISQKIGYPVAIVDVCDFGARVLGASKSVDKNLVAKTLRDNPLGQTNEQTPIGILREAK